MAAFQVRLARLEQRQMAERNELFLSQTRVSQTVAQIRAIEAKALKDPSKIAEMTRNNALLNQQGEMKARKESEHLREIQLCKMRQMKEVGT